MAVGQILTQGLGSFGSSSYVITLGYLADDAPIPPTPPPTSYGGWSGGNIIRKKPKEEPEQVSEQVKEIVEEVAKAVLIDTEAEQRQALKDALQAQEIAFKQAYFDALKKQLIKEYMLAAEYRRIAIKNEEETIVFMMMALA